MITHQKRKFNVVAAFMIVVLISFTGCDRNEDKGAGAREKIIFADGRMPLSAPIYVAREKGFFASEGLDVAIQSHWSGKEALASVIKGEAHVCSVAETPVMFAGLKGEKIFVIATIGDSKKHLKIIGRRDRGIAGPRDLKGKTVGVLKGAAPEYYLDAFLTYHGLKKEDIRIVDVKPEQMADALASGKIDAAVTWRPILAAQQTRLGDNAIILENALIYELQWNVIARQDYVNKNPESIIKLLRALMKADAYVMNNPEEARAITARQTGEESVSLADYDFGLKLGQSMLINLENQARWAIKNRLTDKKEVPNFLPLMYIKGLEAVNPRVVTVIHQ